ncbi:MAG TPA: hypothetical protein VHN16_08590, partial [Streptosporangiaceae bacterium]|nr:hypothetical protein [Streptosporangiaceae bacterium]
MTKTSAQDLQEEFLAALRKGQKTVIDALRIWVDAVTPRLSPLTDRLPMLPDVTVPFAGQLPTPEEAVDSAYRLAEQLLADQRKFAEDVLSATAPLLPGHAKNGISGSPAKPEPKPVAVTPAPKPAAPKPEAKPVAVTPAP